MLLTRNISIFAYITNCQPQGSVTAKSPLVSKALTHFSLRFALGDTAYRFCQIQTSSHRHKVTQNSVTTLRPVCSACHPPTSPAPGNHGSLLFVYFCLHWVFATLRGLPQAAVLGLLRAAASLVVSTGPRARRLQRLQLSGPRARAQEPWCMGLDAPQL